MSAMSYQRRNADLNRVLVEERLRAVNAYERQLVENGAIPDPDRILTQRIKPLMQLLGALCIGLSVAVVTMMANFYIFNMSMHVG